MGCAGTARQAADKQKDNHSFSLGIPSILPTLVAVAYLTLTFFFQFPTSVPNVLASGILI